MSNLALPTYRRYPEASARATELALRRQGRLKQLKALSIDEDEA